MLFCTEWDWYTSLKRVQHAFSELYNLQHYYYVYRNSQKNYITFWSMEKIVCAAFCSFYDVSNRMRLICSAEKGYNMLSQNYAICTIPTTFTGTRKRITLWYMVKIVRDTLSYDTSRIVKFKKSVTPSVLMSSVEHTTEHPLNEFKCF